MPDAILQFSAINQYLPQIKELLGSEKADSFAKRLSEIARETNADESAAAGALDDFLGHYPAVLELLERSRPDLFVDHSVQDDDAAPMTRRTRPAPRPLHPPTANPPSGARPVTGAASAERWTAQTWLQLLKEIVTAVIGLLLVGSTVAMAFATFNLAGSGDKVADAKNILIMMMGLAGVATGYYFGRVPADARANQSETQARAATAHASRVMAKSAQIVDQAEAISSRSVTRAGALDDDDTRSLRSLRRELEELISAATLP
jgi:hypothetical protein